MAESVVFVVDVNPSFFSQHPLAQIIEIISASMRAYRLMKPESRLAVIAAYPDKTEYLLRSEKSGELESEIAKMQQSIIARINSLASDDGLTGDTMISQALSRAVCFIKGRGKIVVFETSSKFSDFSKQHVQISNCGWAVGDRIAVDLVSLNGKSEISAGLANLCTKSNGVQVSLGDSFSGNMQGVLFHILHEAHGILKTADSKLTHSHAGAVCICHGNPLTCGYVCSVCLAIFCSETAPICRLCGSRFRRELRDDSTPLSQRSFADLVG